MKRFYKQAAVEKLSKCYGVTLDGKPVKTPAGNILVVENETLAAYLAEEWQAQEKDILPAMMPVNQIVITALDQTRAAADIIAHILNFTDTDLVYFHSDVSPYKEKQEEAWGRWVVNFEEKHQIKIKTTQALESLTQDIRVRQIFEAYLKNLDYQHLVLFESLVEDTSSPLLSLAFFQRDASAEDIYNAIFVDDFIRAEIYREALYGAAPDQEKKRKAVKRQLAAADKILSLR